MGQAITTRQTATQAKAGITPEAGPNPQMIFQTLNAYQQTAALKAAIELDVFTAIGEGSRTPRDLAQRCQASERGMRTLCDFLVVHNLLTKEGPQYGLTPDAAMFLDRRSPACMGSVAKFICAPDLMDNFKDLTAVIRKGGTIKGEGAVERENPIWEEFARSMVPLMKPTAEELSTLVNAEAGEPWKVLDIAAGHGMYGITVGRKNPNAQIVAVDWANVLKVAIENAEKAGLNSRYYTLPGSAFEVEFGTDYDMVLVTNFLHHFDIPTDTKFLAKVWRALRPGGRAVTVEFVPNEDRVSPPMAATFSMTMLGATPSGDAYTFSQFQEMFRQAGFQRSELHTLRMAPQQVIISYK